MKSTNIYSDFFLNPTCAKHKHYEILRTRFVEKLSVNEIANKFKTPFFTVQSIIRNFKRDFDDVEKMLFFSESKTGPKGDRKKSSVREDVVFLRARGYANTDIFNAFKLTEKEISLSLIDNILREEGLIGLRKRTIEERERIKSEIKNREIPGLTIPKLKVAEIPTIADRQKLILEPGIDLYTRVAGIFLFIPLLVKLGIDEIIKKSNMTGTKMIPSLCYILSLLTLKLLDKERKSHITDWNCDKALGLFAGLNILPKTTAITDYSYRLSDSQQNTLLMEWVKALYPILCPQGAKTFALDFHTIPHRGNNTYLENHYIPTTGKAGSSILTCFGRAIDSPMLCYANADIIQKDKNTVPLDFVKYWEDVTGMQPEWLYFDSKMTTYETLNQLQEKQINFITIRTRGTKMIQKLISTPKEEWKSAIINTPQRKYQKIKYIENDVKLTNYSEPCRQITAKGFGRMLPTVFITNNQTETSRNIITRYINRNHIENDIGVNVNFFHQDCLSSEVRLNVNLDILLTLMANGCYRWLSKNLKGCEKMGPKSLYRKFVETGGHIVTNENELIVKFDRRSHNPIISQAALDKNDCLIPWLNNKKIKFEFS